MAPKDYLRARNDAASSGDESFCTRVDGLPYFPNLSVPSGSEANASAEERNESIKTVVKHVILFERQASLSSSLDLSSWSVTPVTGGNTNQLFCVSGIRCRNNDNRDSPSSSSSIRFPNDSLLVRLFGAEGMVDRDQESSTYAALASQKLALPYYGRFGNGRVEEMLVGWKTLTERDLMGVAAANDGNSVLLPPEDLRETIARRLGKLHGSFRLPPHLLGGTKEEEKQQEPTLWTQLYPWLEKALAADLGTDPAVVEALAKIDPPLAELKKEIDWLKSDVIGSSDDGGENSSNKNNNSIGFCHNDLLASNIMMLTEDPNPPAAENNGATRETTKQHLLLKGLRFIDFEYGGINYYAYDIANHFNEYAGGTTHEDNYTPDYDRCPNKEQQRAFVEAYAEEYNASTNNDASATITVEELAEKIDGFVLANHLVWGLWGFLTAALEECDHPLDYLNYCKCRFREYKTVKAEKY